MNISSTRSARRPAGVAVTAVAALALTAACSSSNNGSDPEASSNQLEIVSWWTSGSEAEALEVLFDAVEAEMPGLDIVNAAVSGGGGANAQQALNARLQGGDPPDAWQLHPDGQLESYVAGGQVADITELWSESGWEEIVPDDVKAVQQVDGAYYTVPIGVHRGNVLWTNPQVLEEAGATIDDTTDLDELLTALETVNGSEATPVCLGDKDIFAASQLLESIIVSVAGPDAWRGLFNGEVSFEDPQVRQGVETYGRFLELANSDHSALTWDEAAMRMADGECAVTLMGDWAYGELVGAGNEPGEDFDWVPFPSEAPAFVYVGDGFSIPAENVPNEEAAMAFLKVLMEPEVQVDFAEKKGSIPAITSAEIDSLSEYQQSAAESFQEDAIVSSLAHAQASSAEIAQVFADAVTTFNGDQNVDAFVSTMAAAQDSDL